jgi:FMN phosphatase YigB (HAD superfamily)
MIKSVIFDIGGVLAFDVWERLFLDSNIGLVSIYDLDREKLQEIGSDLWKNYAYISSSNWKQLEIDYWDQFNNLLGQKIPVDELIELTDKFIRPVKGMPEILRNLYSKDIELAIISNNTEFWFNRQANILDLEKYVPPEKTILSCRIGKPKSSSNFEMYDAVISSLNAKKEECVFIDDRIESISKSNKYGLTSIMFPSHSIYGAHYLEKLLQVLEVL